MALSDPFSTTYQGSFDAGQSLGQGIQSAAGSVADVMKQKQALAQQAKQRKASFDMLKGMGLIQEDTTPPSVDDLKTGLKVAGKTMGKDVNFNMANDLDEGQQRNFLSTLYKSFNIPMPQGKTKTTISPGVSIDLGGGMSYTGQKPIDPMVQEMKAERMDMEKQRLKDQEDSKSSTISTNLNKQVNPMNASRGSQLGKIGETTVRAKRALDLLSDPNFKINSQVLSGIGSDMAGILQGGSPTQIGMNEQGYATLQTTLAKAGQYLDAHPGDALPDDMRDYLTTTFNKLNDTGKYYIKNNFKTVEDLQKPWVSKNKDIWDSTKKDIYDTYGLEDNSFNGATSTLKAAGMGTQSKDDKILQQQEEYKSYMKSIGK